MTITTIRPRGKGINTDRVQNWYQKNEVSKLIPMMIVKNWYQKNECDKPLGWTDVCCCVNLIDAKEKVMGEDSRT